MADPPQAPAATAVPGTPPTFRLRLRLLTPLELEQERAGASFTPHFAGKDYRIRWGAESVSVNFSSAPADVQAKAKTRKVDAAHVQVPFAYYGTVGADGTVSRDVNDVPNGEHVIEIGEYQDAFPPKLTPELWALDQRAPKQPAGQHFNPLVIIPLERFDPPPQPAEAFQVELWWRLWNLGLIGERPPTFPEHARDSVTYRGPTLDFSTANKIARAQWNFVRDRVSSFAEDPGTDDVALMDELHLHHDRLGSKR